MKRFSLVSLAALFILLTFAPQEAVAQLLRRAQPVQQQRAAQNANGKIHMLFVWGTKATDTHWATKISQAKIEQMFKEIGLTKNSPQVGTYLTLDGNNATPQNIINACRQLAQNARPNDAVFVYILCHGASVVEDGDTTGTRVHALSPVCESAEKWICVPLASGDPLSFGKCNRPSIG
jgi:hypothetical protein